MSGNGKQGHTCAKAEVSDARETVRRFLAHGQFIGRFESLSQESAFAAPSDDQVDLLAQQLNEAAHSDPLAYAILAGTPSEQHLRADIHAAFGEILSSPSDPKLSGAQRSALEAISLLTGRPALLVKKDDFDLPNGIWEQLAPFRPELQKMLQAVGRIELPPEYGSYAGTAFVVGHGLVMTNRHVLDHLYSTQVDASALPIAWDFIPDLHLTLDFKREAGSDERAEFRITGIAAIFPKRLPNTALPDLDLALLRVATDNVAGRKWPGPVRIQNSMAQVRDQRRVCVAGYPAADPAHNDKDRMDAIYGSVYDVKRLSPGTITGFDVDRASLRHDCTTLGGNSGSCVFDIDTNSVVGLHWGGNYLEPNHALLLPALFSDPVDPRLHGVNFQGD